MVLPIRLSGVLALRCAGKTSTADDRVGGVCYFAASGERNRDRDQRGAASEEGLTTMAKRPVTQDPEEAVLLPPPDRVNGNENITLDDIAVWPDDKANDQRWLPAFEALEHGVVEPLKRMLLSEYELHPAQRLWLADFFDRHQFRLAKPGPSTPIYHRPYLERIKLWADNVYKRLREEGINADTAFERTIKKFAPLGLTAKNFADYRGKGGRTRRETRKRLVQKNRRAKNAT